MVKTGLGIDIHPLKLGRKCRLGGIEIDSDYGPDGHSDADVVIHALIDAILGSCALGDIGQWFPDNDPTYKDADSVELLKTVVEACLLKGVFLQHIDITVVAEKPRIAPYVIAIRENLASILGLTVNNISVKATTSEKMGFIGRAEGLAAMALVTVLEKEKDNQGKKIDYRKFSPQTLAYMGDAVLELHVRQFLLAQGVNKGFQLQRLALQFVSASAQASMCQEIMPYLTEEEKGIWRWGRNSHGGNIPKNTDAVSYRHSTGLEALLGYLYLSNHNNRLQEIIKMLITKRQEKLKES